MHKLKGSTGVIMFSSEKIDLLLKKYDPISKEFNEKEKSVESALDEIEHFYSDDLLDFIFVPPFVTHLIIAGNLLFLVFEDGKSISSLHYALGITISILSFICSFYLRQKLNKKKNNSIKSLFLSLSDKPFIININDFSKNKLKVIIEKSGTVQYPNTSKSIDSISEKQESHNSIISYINKDASCGTIINLVTSLVQQAEERFK